jgi:hypothetical protein
VRAVAAFLPPGAPAPAEQIQQRVVELHGSRLAALSGLSLPMLRRDAGLSKLSASIQPIRERASGQP